MKKTLALLALGLIANAASPAHADSTGVASYNATGASALGLNAGFDFTTSTTITVKQLGVFDSNNSLNSGGQQTIFLYDVTTSTLVASVLAPTTGLFNNAFNYAALASPVVIGTGQVYSVFSNFSGPAAFANGSITLASDLTDVLPNGAANTGKGLYDGTGPFPPTVSGSYIATDFIYVPGTVVLPEPASLALTALGLASVAALARRKLANRPA